jgi:hypothetical protein
MASTYAFQNQLTKGERAEGVLDVFLASDHEITPVSLAEQRRGIDRVFVRRTTGRRFTVQYKADWTAHRTGNAFIETVSVDTNNVPGWALTSQADWLIYYLPRDRHAYAIRMAVIRDKVVEWSATYPTTAVQNMDYHTHGVLVPLQELALLCDGKQGRRISGMPLLME